MIVSPLLTSPITLALLAVALVGMSTTARTKDGSLGNLRTCTLENLHPRGEDVLLLVSLAHDD